MNRTLTIFVLGGKGFVGSAFVEEAKRQKHSVIAITHANYARYRGRRCDLFINANGNSKKFLAAQAPVEDFDKSVRSTLQSLLDFRYGTYVFLSSIAVYASASRPAASSERQNVQPPHPSRYGFHKWLAELLVRQYAANWIILRLAGMMGPNMTKGPLYDLLHRVPLRLTLRSRLQFMSTTDVARIAYTLARKRKRNFILNVAGHGSVALSKAQFPGRKARVRADAVTETWNTSTRLLKSLVGGPRTADLLRRFLDDHGRGR